MVFNSQAKDDAKSMILVNPKIVSKSEDTDEKEEGLKFLFSVVY